MHPKKKLAAKVLKTSPYKVRFTAAGLADITKAITRSDMRGLLAVGKVEQTHDSYHSRSRARRHLQQKRKGRRKGRGSHRGSKHSIVTRKRQWITGIRVQRTFLKELRNKELLSPATYRMLYSKSKGGFFRNKRHIKLYLTEHNLFQKAPPT